MNLTPLLENGWLNAILPEMVLCIGGIVLILWDAFAPKLRGATAPLAVIVFLAAGWSERLLIGGNFFGGTYQVSAITIIFDYTFLLAAILATLFARAYLARERFERGEFYALLMWGTVGMMRMAKGLDLLIIVLGLELLSICIFIHEACWMTGVIEEKMRTRAMSVAAFGAVESQPAIGDGAP